MNIGFTGPQEGMTGAQEHVFRALMCGIVIMSIEHVPHKFHHGMCIGADAQAHGIVFSLKLPIIGHPPINTSKMMIGSSMRFTEIRPAKDYIPRNHDIVDETDVLIGTPKSTVEEIRSGTWSTIRYARKQAKKTIIIFPDGNVKVHDP